MIVSKEQNGFLMLNAMFSVLVVTFSMYALFQLTGYAQKKILRLQKLVDSVEASQTVSYCADPATCNVVVACVKDVPNAKDFTYCDGACVYSGSVWTLDGDSCLEVLGR